MGVFDRLLALLPWRRTREERLTEAPSGGKRDPYATVIKRVGLANVENVREFSEPEVDLNQITAAYNTEAYIRQAIDKHITLIFKAGYEFVGKNPNAVQYIRTRFKAMAEATSLPTPILFREIATDVVKYANAITLKSRAQDLSVMPKGLKVMGVGGRQPVAGYFPANVTQFKVLRDKFGTVKQWQQEVEGSDKPVKFKAEDVVHIWTTREKGNAFGTPFVIPALDDARALRQAEEHVLRLIYRNLFPYFHYQVGLDKEGYEGTDPEVDAVRAALEDMDLEAGLVTTERHNVKSIASNQIIDAYNYLKHFEERLFSGLGVSATLMGRGGTANRSTADTLSSEMRDTIKGFQRVIECFVDQLMINELLLEGGFDPLLKPEDEVGFKFNEIDVDAQIKRENQAVYLFEHNAVGHEEMRLMLGRDPYEGEQGLFKDVVTIPVAEATAALRPAPAEEGGSKEETENKVKPKNQYGQKTSPKKKAEGVEGDEETSIRDLYEASLTKMYDTMEFEVRDLVFRFYESGRPDVGKELAAILSSYDHKFKALTEQWSGRESVKANLAWSRMLRQLNEQVVGTMNDVECVSFIAQEAVHSIFTVLRDRLEWIADEAFTAPVAV